MMKKARTSRVAVAATDYLVDLARYRGQIYGWRLMGEDMPLRRSELDDQMLLTWRHTDIERYLALSIDARTLEAFNRDRWATQSYWQDDIDRTLKYGLRQLKDDGLITNFRDYIPKEKAPSPAEPEALPPEWGEVCL